MVCHIFKLFLFPQYCNISFLIYNSLVIRLKKKAEITVLKKYVKIIEV